MEPLQDMATSTSPTWPLASARDMDAALLGILDKLEFDECACALTGKKTTEGSRSFGLMLAGKEVQQPPRAAAAEEVARAIVLWKKKTDTEHNDKHFTTIVVTFCRAAGVHRDSDAIGCTSTRALLTFATHYTVFSRKTTITKGKGSSRTT